MIWSDVLMASIATAVVIGSVVAGTGQALRELRRRIVDAELRGDCERAACDAALRRAEQAEAAHREAENRAERAEADRDAIECRAKQTEAELRDLKRLYREQRKELFAESDAHVENATFREDLEGQVCELVEAASAALARLSAARKEIARKEATEEIKETLNVLERLFRGS